MMPMLVDSWDAFDIRSVDALKSLFICNTLDGSEDLIVSDKLYELVGAKKNSCQILLQLPSKN